MLQDKIKNIQPELEKITQHLKTELAGLRTSRATPTLVENIPVEYYGTKVPLKQISAITTDGRLIVIDPWNKDDLTSIVKAISESDLGLVPSNDGIVIRIIVPPLTEERRTQLVKILGQKLEKARISVKTLREKIRNQIKEAEKAKEMGEDEKFRLQEELQEEIDRISKQIKEMGEAKEKEIMTV